MVLVVVFLILGATQFFLIDMFGNAPLQDAFLYGLFVVFMLTFLVAELNRKIQKSGVAIGLVLALAYSLPTLLRFAYYGMPVKETQFMVVAYLVALPLSSYIFETLWSKHPTCTKH
tara:strand:+ start:416 stop:763 length:348 start_codon:yes stop_codon:yes gene_type:complete